MSNPDAIVSTIRNVFVGFFAGAWFCVLVTSVAAAEIEQQYTCPVEVFPAVTIHSAHEITISNQTLLTSATVANQTEYNIGGVRVGIALFDQGAAVPRYWTILPKEFQLFPHSSLDVLLELDAQHVGFGRYDMKVVAVQGSAGAVLGALIHEHSPKTSVSVRKQSNSTAGAAITVAVEEGERAGGRQVLEKKPFTVKATVSNNSALPLLDSQTVVVVSEGFVPLGSAIRAEKQAALTLVPGSQQATILKNVSGGAGEHVVYAGVLTAGVLQPVAQLLLALPGEHEGRWSYLSRVGLSEYPVQEDSTVVACVDVVGTEPNATDFFEELGVDFLVRNESGVLAKKTLYAGDVGTKGFIAYQPKTKAKNVSISASLLQLRYPTYVPLDGEETSFSAIVRGQLVSVQQVNQVFICASAETCGNTALINQAPEGSAAEAGESFWFYAGIVLAALLLMYLLLRRLPGGEVDAVTTNRELSSGELQ